MSIAKGKLFVSKEELAELFGLPEGVEILAVEEAREFDDSFEFLIVSEVETTATKKDIPVGRMRRVSLKLLKTLKDSEDKKVNDWHPAKLYGKDETILTKSQTEAMTATATVPSNSFTITVNNTLDEKLIDTKELFENIIKGLKQGRK